MSGWSIQDLNLCTESAGKPQVTERGAVKIAVRSANSDFAGAIQAIMALPLTDAEKAETMRHLLANSANTRPDTS